MSAKPITIAGVHYPQKGVIEARLKLILGYGGENDAITNPDDVALLSVLFYARKSKIAELKGRTVIGWGRERNSTGICLAALCHDGTRVHFSKKHSLDAFYEKQGKK